MKHSSLCHEIVHYYIDNDMFIEYVHTPVRSSHFTSILYPRKSSVESVDLSIVQTVP
jgi:hypothetical protein